MKFNTFCQFAVLLATAWPAVGQSVSLPATVQQPKRPQWSWQTETWTGNNAAYTQIRRDFDALIIKGEKPPELAERYGKLARENRLDPLVQFRWAYAVRKAALTSYPSNSDDISAAMQAMDLTRKPHAYDYTRLRFLLSVLDHGTENLLPVGNRLLTHNPEDVDVKYALTGLLCHSPDLADKRKAVQYAQELVKLAPEKPRYHACLAAAYMNLWPKSGDPTDGKRAVAEYKIYLETAPEGEAFRKDAKFWLDEILRCQDENGRYEYKPIKPKQ